ncbi:MULTISPECIES: GIY-YIG nuclease family protein [Vibrio]|nr:MULTISPECIES: GIY-YIG nuclease family protein [Vibrio]OOH98726.1 hypothetical protein BIW15_23255 [Vibrio sp. SALL6]
MNLDVIRRNVDSDYWVYILRLEGNRFYVGVSKTPEMRIFNHIHGFGSTWTLLYSPFKVEHIQKLEGVSDYRAACLIEKRITLEAANSWGGEYVRGSTFTNVDFQSSWKSKYRGHGLLDIESFQSLSEECFERIASEMTPEKLECANSHWSEKSFNMPTSPEELLDLLGTRWSCNGSTRTICKIENIVELEAKTYDAEVYWALDDKPVRKNSMRFQVMKTWLKKAVRVSA